MSDHEQELDNDEVEGHLTIISKKDAGSGQGVMHSNAMAMEDAYYNFYYTATNEDGTVLLPPYDLMKLRRMPQENNALGQCVSAYETNIAGTGYSIEAEGSEEPTAEQEKTILDIEEFFDEPFPGTSFTTLRRELRRDQESLGFAYMEVIRNGADAITFLKHMPSQTVRMVKLDDAIPVKHKVKRFGREVTLTLMTRERRYCQLVGTRMVFFKEFGASRDLDKDSGEWAPPGKRLPLKKRATELLAFGVHRDADSPYHVPRWINQVPSVLGSRRAEELNLDYLDAGGLPPALIMVQGGTMTAEVRKQLEKYLRGGTKQQFRAAIVELMSSGGSLDKADPVKVTVERFGSESVSDSMFENYDQKCEERIRSSFRLPPLFVGRVATYNYATALMSYIVAEAQVFKPERDEFDEVINRTIMREMAPGFVFRSHGLSLKDIQTQITALGIAANASAITKQQLIDTLNEVADTNMKVADGEADVVTGAQTAHISVTDTQTTKREMSDPLGMATLVDKWSRHLMEGQDFSEEEMQSMKKAIAEMPDDQKELFDSLLAGRVLTDLDHDPAGLRELSSCLCSMAG